MKPNYDRLIYPLFTLYLLLIPWVKLEIIRSITWADPIFLILFFVIALKWLSGDRTALAHHPTARNFGVLSAFWIIAIGLSFIHAQYLSTYFFEATGLVYLLMACFIAISLSQSETSFERVYKWLKISITVVAVVGTVGLLVLLITGSVNRLFFAAEDALVATFRRPNQFAGFLALFIPVIWEELKLAKHLNARFLYGAVLAMLTLCMLFANSKTGLVALALIVAIYFVVALFRSNFRTVLIVGGSALGVYIAGFLLADSVPLIERIYSEMGDFIRQGQLTDDWRINNWSTGIELFSQHPITGIGIANTRMLYEHEIHNTYIAVLAEMGLIGFTALLATLGFSLYSAIRNIQIARMLSHVTYQALARAQLVGLIAFMLFMTQHMMLRQRYFWVALGLIYALNWLLKSKLSEATHTKPAKIPSTT